MNDYSVLNELTTACPHMNIYRNEEMKERTFIKVGGKADYYVQPSSLEETAEVVRIAHARKIPLTVLGFGSNVIVRDSGIRGIVLNMNRLNTILVDECRIIAECGASFIDVSRTARDFSLSGLEFACGIPGSVGGALMMNAGAYGGEVSFVLEQATILTKSGEIKSLDASQFQFGYRSSIFEREGYIVMNAVFRLEKGELADIQGKMDEFTNLREDKQPLEYPSCGSVFKRPPNMFAGKLISDSGLQGLRIGGAEVSTKHAGFIVNIDHATSTDYLELIAHVKKTVKEKFDVELETEVKIIGDQPQG
ncbi:UDP-N-acetylmuramate dehydrogenase [Paenibacillus sp. CAU 1782]